MRNQIKLKYIFSYLWVTLTKGKISERIEERWRTNESFNIQSNSVITNSRGPLKNVRYNRETL